MSKLVNLDILHDFLQQLVRKLWQVKFARWPPAAILNSEQRDHLRREHLSDFERQWSELLISSESPLPLKMDNGLSDSSMSK